MRVVGFLGAVILAADIIAFALIWSRGGSLGAGLYAAPLVLALLLGAGLLLFGSVVGAFRRIR